MCLVFSAKHLAKKSPEVGALKNMDHRVGCRQVSVCDSHFSNVKRTGKNLEGPTRRPRHASVFSTHSDTQAVPAFHCIRMFKGKFRHASVFKTHRRAVFHCLKEVQKPFRHASVFRTRVSTRACPFLIHQK